MKSGTSRFCMKLRSMLNDEQFINESKKRKQDFIRTRKFGFADTVGIILSKTGKGIKSAVRAFKESVGRENISYSQQAFSKGRTRIKWEAFRALHNVSVTEFYDNFEVKKYRGYRVCAIDGSKINLPYHSETASVFGVLSFSNDQTQALCSCMCDVLNNVVIDAVLEQGNASERKLADQHVTYLSEINNDKELLLFDRGYISSGLMKHIEDNHFSYVMRVTEHSIKKMLAKVKSKDEILTHTFFDSKISLTLRLLKLEIPGTDTIEYLLTNILDPQFTPADFLKIYHMRWGIESRYDDLKNKLFLENFTGITPLAIRQDFYATMLLLNMAAMIANENEDEINRLHNTGNNTYFYKANINQIISLMKTNVIKMVMYSGTRKGNRLLKYIYNEVRSAVVPVRPGRSFPRAKKHPHNKFAQNLHS